MKRPMTLAAACFSLFRAFREMLNTGRGTRERKSGRGRDRSAPLLLFPRGNRAITESGSRFGQLRAISPVNWPTCPVPVPENGERDAASLIHILLDALIDERGRSCPRRGSLSKIKYYGTGSLVIVTTSSVVTRSSLSLQDMIRAHTHVRIRGLFKKFHNFSADVIQ